MRPSGFLPPTPPSFWSHFVHYICLVYLRRRTHTDLSHQNQSISGLGLRSVCFRVSNSIACLLRRAGLLPPFLWEWIILRCSLSPACLDQYYLSNSYIRCKIYFFKDGGKEHWDDETSLPSFIIHVWMSAGEFIYQMISLSELTTSNDAVEQTTAIFCFTLESYSIEWTPNAEKVFLSVFTNARFGIVQPLSLK